VADLPDRETDLFIRLCLQNTGRMSQAKRTSAFAALSDDEVERGFRNPVLSGTTCAPL